MLITPCNVDDITPHIADAIPNENAIGAKAGQKNDAIDKPPAVIPKVADKAIIMVFAFVNF